MTSTLISESLPSRQRQLRLSSGVFLVNGDLFERRIADLAFALSTAGFLFGSNGFEFGLCYSVRCRFRGVEQRTLAGTTFSDLQPQRCWLARIVSPTRPSYSAHTAASSARA